MSDGTRAFIIDEPLPLFPKPRLIEVASNFRTGRFENGTLFYATPFELSRWDGNETNFLTRFGAPIISLLYVPAKNGVLIALPEELQIYSLDRERLTLTLASVKNISVLTVSDDGKTAYFYGRFEDKEGLFRIEF